MKKEDLLKLIRDKYPQYDEVADEELYNLVISKFPQYESVITKKDASKLSEVLTKSFSTIVSDTFKKIGIFALDLKSFFTKENVETRNAIEESITQLVEIKKKIPDSKALGNIIEKLNNLSPKELVTLANDILKVVKLINDKAVIPEKFTDKDRILVKLPEEQLKKLGGGRSFGFGGGIDSETKNILKDIKNNTSNLEITAENVNLNTDELELIIYDNLQAVIVAIQDQFSTLEGIYGVDSSIWNRLGDILNDLDGLNTKDYSTETTLALIKAVLDIINTTLSDVLTDLDGLNAKDFATETTLASIGSKIDSLETQPSFSTGAKSGISTTAVQLHSGSIPAKDGIALRSDPANTGTIYVGSSNAVTKGTVDATDGFPLQPGEFFTFRANDINLVWLIATAASQRLFWTVV